MIGQPAHEGAVEHGGQFGLEDRPLFLERICGEYLAQIDAVETRREMSEPDEAAKQPLPVDPAGEMRNPPAPGEVAALPISAALRVEMWRNRLAVNRRVFLVVGFREEPTEAFVIGQVADRRDLELAQRDMRTIKIDRDHFGGVGSEIGQRVAAAAGDTHHAHAGADLQPFHVDYRVFPDLRIDQPFEGQRESPVEQPVARFRILADHRIVDDPFCHCRHGRSCPRSYDPRSPLGRARVARMTVSTAIRAASPQSLPHRYCRRSP